MVEYLEFLFQKADVLSFWVGTFFGFGICFKYFRAPVPVFLFNPKAEIKQLQSKCGENSLRWMHPTILLKNDKRVDVICEGFDKESKLCKFTNKKCVFI